MFSWTNKNLCGRNAFCKFFCRPVGVWGKQRDWGRLFNSRFRLLVHCKATCCRTPAPPPVGSTSPPPLHFLVLDNKCFFDISSESRKNNVWHHSSYCVREWERKLKWELCKTCWIHSHRFWQHLNHPHEWKADGMKSSSSGWMKSRILRKLVENSAFSGARWAITENVLELFGTVVRCSTSDRIWLQKPALT